MHAGSISRISMTEYLLTDGCCWSGPGTCPTPASPVPLVVPLHPSPAYTVPSHAISVACYHLLSHGFIRGGINEPATSPQTATQNRFVPRVWEGARSGFSPTDSRKTAKYEVSDADTHFRSNPPPPIHPYPCCAHTSSFSGPKDFVRSPEDYCRVMDLSTPFFVCTPSPCISAARVYCCLT